MLATDDKLGDLIRQRRKELGLTQADLATRTGLSLSAIQFIETGRRTPRIATLMAIKTALDLDDARFSFWLKGAA